MKIFTNPHSEVKRSETPTSEARSAERQLVKHEVRNAN